MMTMDKIEQALELLEIYIKNSQCSSYVKEVDNRILTLAKQQLKIIKNRLEGE